MPLLKIVADENIPMVETLFRRFGEVRILPGRQISREDVKDADVLLVRSVTRVDKDLMKGSAVRFVGSATIGTDHIETEFLNQRGTAFANAPGSNADSVVEYVIAALLRLAVRRNDCLRGKVVGIVGCGQIGGRLATRLPALGLTIIKNDPPLADRANREGRRHDFLPIEDLLASADIVTIHVPLVTGGEYGTVHLFGRRRLARMRRGSWLLNTARGAVVDNDALTDILSLDVSGPDAAVLDVWENEPLPAPALVERIDLATPHIAGYSYDGKIAGTLMLFDALAKFLGQDGSASVAAEIQGDAARPLIAPDPILPEADWLHALVLQMYDIGPDDQALRGIIRGDDSHRAAGFSELRRDYPVRRTFQKYRIATGQVPDAYLSPVRTGLQVG